MNEVQHYKEHRDQQWSAWVISDWAKLIVAIRFVQEAKRLNQMHSYIREEAPPEFYAISDSLKEPQSCMTSYLTCTINCESSCTFLQR